MVLPATSPSHPAVPALPRPFTAPAPHKALWVAVGLLGACVVALATALVVQNLSLIHI